MRILVGMGVLFCLVCTGFLVGTYLWLSEAGSPPTNLQTPVEIQVSPGMITKDVAGLLKQGGLINSSLVFRLWVGIYGVGNKLKPGKYIFKAGATIEELIKSLVDGREETFRLTIPEGLTIQAISGIIEQAGICPAASFSRIVSNPERLNDIFRSWGEIGNPEGLLFPETYTFAKGISPVAVAESMMRATKDRVDDVLKMGNTEGFSPYQACILASIVEREGKLSEEKPLIASVFHNRLKKKIRLESCATVQYALGEHKDRLLLEDLKVNSPFNTYLNEGLPPSPIANFGMSSLSAVASPASSDYLFFVSDAAAGHRFSKTLAEHERSKKIFFQDRKKLNNQ